MDQTSSMAQSSSENVPEPQSAGIRRSSRASSPDFPLQPSPDMPAWMTKCLKIITGPPEDVKTELLKLLDECSHRREQRDRQEAAIPLANSMVPKKEAKIQPAKIPANLPIPPVKTNPASKKRPASPNSNDLKQISSLAPPVVTLQSPSSPEFLPPPTSMTLSAGTSEGMDIVVSSGSGASGAPMDVDEVIDLAMLLEDPCFVCGQGREEPGNRLLDCESCRKKFHQQCHVPKVTDIDPSDTRLIWYCAQCSAECARKATNIPSAELAVPSPPASVAQIPVAPPPKPHKPMATKTVQNKEMPSTSAGTTSIEPFKRETAKTSASGSQGRGLGGYASSIKKDTKANPSSKR
ncbi:hypothetical protein RvY_12720 [Ramazzottius varieornatus]|uniref:Integrator complex subunit 12 n=1 Tax=Ramazzottius varieornatus TaxID=947166 RepID=A0A1D1VQW5_RAMVA|nr:hypothetical protein RvY_12720 [Ramazzottius varieornatus]